MAPKKSSIIATVEKTISEYGLLANGDHILVGLSGGPDSTALLHILHRLRNKLDLSLAAVYINHKLRPRAAKKEARFCDDLCADLQIDFHYNEIDINDLAAEQKTGIEETARNYRYMFFTELANDENYDAVAVGHHRDDRVETILFNLLRGSGRQGLIGMPAGRDLFIRPLYDLSRQQIIGWLDKNKLAYMTDKSNQSPRYTRNRIRHKVIPLLEKEISESAAGNIIRFSEILADEERFLEKQSSRISGKLISTTPGGKFKLDLARILEYDIWLLRRLVRRFFSRAGLSDIVFADIDRTLDLIGGGRDSRLSITGGMTAEKAGYGLYLYGRKKRFIRQEVIVPGSYRLRYPKISISLEFTDNCDVNIIKEGSPRQAFLDAGKLSGKLYIDGIKLGERFHPFRRPGSKKATDFLTDRKYPRPLRDELPVLYDDHGIVWLAGVEIDDRVKIDSKTKKMVKLEIERS
ncbi:MAG: tRNA lysidine(34) synthetase TilS [FCB group bacterium]|nr:tRNA lysidine(34) synthetase TilS [FCB group bacterium]